MDYQKQAGIKICNDLAREDPQLKVIILINQMVYNPDEIPLFILFIAMKTQARVILWLLVAVVGVTHLYRQYQDNAVMDARARLLATLDTTKINTTYPRTDNSQTYCTKPRSELVSSTEQASTTSYFNTLKMYFSVDPYFLNQVSILLIKAGMSLDMTSLQSAATGMMGGAIVYIVPFALGLILSLVLWSCLCCCCCCPSCCPSKCCQHDENLLYTKCEMLWPVIFLITTLLLACAASIPGIMRASIVSDSIETMQCGISLTLDDIINGNVTNDKSSFFLGTETMVNRLTDLQGNVTTIINDLTTNLSTDVGNIKNNYSNAKTNIDILPNGTTANTTYVLDYSNPLLSTASPYPSGFGTVLGTANDSATITGILFQIVDGIGSAMTTLDSALSTLNSASGTIVGNIGTAKDSVANFSTIFKGVDGTVGGLFSASKTVLPYVKIAFLVFFGVVLGLAVIALLGVIIMACFDKPGCRHLMYFSCIVMTFITILGYLLSFILSLIVPIMFLTCTVINSGIDSQASFQNMSTTLGLDPNMTSPISICLPGGDGQILNSLGSVSTTINSNINSIMTSMNTSNTYSTYDTTNLTNALANVTNAFSDYKTAKRNDITYQSTTLDIFKSIANRTKYNTCTDTNFDADSLVPSTDALSTANIPCASGTTIQTCTSFVFPACPVGCLDLYGIFTGYGTGAGVATQIRTDLAARYPTLAGSCIMNLQDDIANMYTAWHIPRTDTSNGIASVETRYNTGVKADVNSIITSLGSLSPKMTTTFASLNTTMNPLVDPTYGLIAGINCLLLGEDIVLTKNTVCVSLFNSFYFLFVTIGTSSFALLFSMCCIVCSGVRHYKQNLKKESMKIKGQGQQGGYGMGMNGDSQTYLGRH